MNFTAHWAGVQAFYLGGGGQIWQNDEHVYFGSQGSTITLVRIDDKQFGQMNIVAHFYKKKPNFKI